MADAADGDVGEAVGAIVSSSRVAREADGNLRDGDVCAEARGNGKEGNHLGGHVGQLT